MSAYVTDRRPRLLFFAVPYAADAAFARVRIAWPCHVYRVMLPVRRSGGLNLFEETVLKLLPLARGTEDELAAMTCIPRELIRFVLARLRDLGLADDRAEITVQGDAWLAKQEARAAEYEMGMVFRERISGQLIPVVHRGELEVERLEKWGPDHAVVRSHAEKTANYRRLPPAQGMAAAPTVAEVNRAIRLHQRLLRQSEWLGGRAAGALPALAPAGAIQINEHPEDFSLLCQVVLPEAQGELVTDPFGQGYSDLLTSAFRELAASNGEIAAWLLEKKKWALGREIVAPREAAANAGDVEADDLRPCPEVRRHWKKVQRELAVCRDQTAGSDAEAKMQGSRDKVFLGLYAALEWALKYAVALPPDSMEETLLTGGTRETNREYLEKLARRLGFELDPACQRMLEVPPGRVRQLRAGSADMQALLAVALVGAAHEAAHPLRRVAAWNPQWLLFIRALKEYRDCVAHGKPATARLAEVEAFVADVAASLRQLLPALYLVTDATSDHEPESRSRLARRRAEVALEEFFGFQGNRALPQEVRRILLEIEKTAMAWAEICGEVNASEAIQQLAGALEGVLSQCLEGFRTRLPDAGKSPHELAAESAAAAGFALADGRLPDELASVQARHVFAALRGVGGTLGGGVLALLLSAPPGWLRRLAQVLPGFLGDCAMLARERGHTNQRNIMPQSRFSDIKTATFTLCRQLLEN